MTPQPLPDHPARITPADPHIDVPTTLGPATLVAVIPSLLGFTPEYSAVIIGLRATASGQPCVVATARVDLPDVELADDIAAWSDWLADTVQALIHRSDTHICVIWDAGSLTYVRDMAQAAQTALIGAGADLADVLIVDDGHWWSLTCDEHPCCPSTGHPIDPAAIDQSRATLGLSASEPAESRRDVESELAFESPRGDWPSEPPDVAAGAFEVAVAHTVNALTGGPPCREEDLVLIGIALSDIRVRDTVIWDVLSTDRKELAPAIAVLSEALRCAPDDYVAPLAACVGLFQWQFGDGIRACIAVQRSLEADPGYSFSQLLMQCIGRGVSPDEWWEGLRLIGRDRCAGQW